MDKERIFYWILGIVSIIMSSLLLRDIATDVINKSFSISNTLLIILGFTISIVYLSKASK